MKLLFTSVGRRVELIQAFKKVANESNIDLHIIGADISVSAPALFYCDSQEIICRISDATYIPSLLKLCKVNEVDCLIPTIDTDLLQVLFGSIEDVSAVTSDSVFFELNPGENEILISTDSVTTLDVTAIWQNRWL